MKGDEWKKRKRGFFFLGPAPDKIPLKLANVTVKIKKKPKKKKTNNA
jgi:hypothetical protein